MPAKNVLLVAVLVLVFSPFLAAAGDEISVNQALKNNHIAYLNGIYNLDDQIILHTGDQLIGFPGTVLNDRSPFFTGSKSIIYGDGDDISINGIEINGNCNKFDSSLASTPGHSHDNQQAIRIRGSSDNFCQNITIKNVKIENCFSDGCNLWYCKNVRIENIKCYNC